MASDLSRDDLFLLMQSYENTVQLNTTLLNQHKQLLEDSSNILKKHSEIIINLNSLTDKQQKISDTLSDIILKITDLSDHNQKQIDDIEKKIDEHRVESLNNHNQQKTKIMIVGAAIGTVVITLLGIVGQMWMKYDIISSIAKSLGVE
jgi:hypothetical protein